MGWVSQRREKRHQAPEGEQWGKGACGIHRDCSASELCAKPVPQIALPLLIVASPPMSLAARSPGVSSCFLDLSPIYGCVRQSVQTGCILGSLPGFNGISRPAGQQGSLPRRHATASARKAGACSSQASEAPGPAAVGTRQRFCHHSLPSFSKHSRCC